MATKVAGELYESITGQLFEIGRQLRQQNGYGFDPNQLKEHLQLAVEGKFNGATPTISASVAVAHPTPVVFTIWKTIKRPANASAAYYRDSYKKKGIQLGTYADQILDKVDWSEGPNEIDIARVFVRDLGFKRATRRDTIYTKAFASGVEKLPAWVPPELCDNYDDQPNGEWLVAGMEPLADSDGYPRLFRVGRRDDGGRWLDDRWGSPARKWSPDDEFLFSVPRKSLQVSAS